MHKWYDKIKVYIAIDLFLDRHTKVPIKILHIYIYYNQVSYVNHYYYLNSDIEQLKLLNLH